MAGNTFFKGVSGHLSVYMNYSGEEISAILNQSHFLLHGFLNKYKRLKRDNPTVIIKQNRVLTAAVKQIIIIFEKTKHHLIQRILITCIL